MSKYPNLAAEMSRFGVKPQTIADHVGVDTATVSRWLSKSRPESPSVSQALRIKELFPGVSTNYLFLDVPMVTSVVADEQQ